VAGTLLTFIPATGDYNNAPVPGRHEPGDDRQCIRRCTWSRTDRPFAARAKLHPDGDDHAPDRAHLLRFAGAEAVDGDESERRLMRSTRQRSPQRTTRRSVLWAVWKWLREHALNHLLGLAIRLHARPDRAAHRLPFNNPQGRSTSPGGRNAPALRSIPSPSHS